MAKRGDLAVIEVVTSYARNSGPTQYATRYRVAVVTSVTRAGEVKAIQIDGCAPQPVARIVGFQRLHLLPKNRVDVAAAQEAARAHAWPGGQPSRPFESLDDVRAALRPCLLSE